MNSMLDMYVKCGSLEKAGKIFETMEVKDMFSWTSMINGYVKHGEVELARKLFDEMRRGMWSLGGYLQNNRPKDALELFHDMEREAMCFIDMYAKCGNIDAAGEIFDGMMKKDLVSYYSMIVAYASHGHAGKALGLFEHIREVGFKPDDITSVGVLSACAHGGLVKKGWDYFRATELFGLTPAMEHYTCMIDLLGRVGHLEEAYELIRSMPMEPHEAIWGALLNGCRMHGNVELGKFAAEKLIVLDPKDSGTYMLLVSLCANKRKWGDVRMARSMMRDNGVKKTPGSSSIELEGVFHDFLVADELHPESEAIYRVLGEILLLSKLDDYTTHTCQIDTFL
ncbi:UNVERIFIED_CONTAM: Pentatricopeptide repeat-containing protein, chloroplastic [Sesamum angustifolium]|uniref:Pentatricopeptide repeat-containing protein, chloroplastic n=1 Tax=Sesamum angustifolium TaxID=2727405 RepID=A0AAW2M8C9_9LAMI